MAYNETPMKGCAVNTYDNLIAMLKLNPGHVYINTDGTHLFALVGPEEKLMIATCLVKNFHDMTEEEVNTFIQNLLK